MNNDDVLEIHAVLCEITNKEITRYDGLYKMLGIINTANNRDVKQ